MEYSLIVKFLGYRALLSEKFAVLYNPSIYSILYSTVVFMFSNDAVMVNIIIFIGHDFFQFFHMQCILCIFSRNCIFMTTFKCIITRFYRLEYYVLT